VDRKQFIDAALKLGVYSCALPPLAAEALGRTVPAQDDNAVRIGGERDFVLNWLSDLLDAMDRELDPAVAGLTDGSGAILEGALDPSPGKISGERSVPARYEVSGLTFGGTLTFRYTLTPR